MGPLVPCSWWAWGGGILAFVTMAIGCLALGGEEHGNDIPVRNWCQEREEEEGVLSLGRGPSRPVWPWSRRKGSSAPKCFLPGFFFWGGGGISASLPSFLAQRPVRSLSKGPSL